MCSSPKVDNTAQRQAQEEAAEARQREAERQARIRGGTAQVDQTFQGFDDNFFNQRRDAFMGYYQPQLEDRFKDAREQLTFGLARAGTLRSSAAADKQTRLGQDYELQRAGIASKADADVGQLRSRVNAEKSALVSQLNATGDADRVSNEALGRSQMLMQDRPSYDMLPDIFGGIASGIGNAFQGFNQNSLGSSGAGATNPRSTKSSRLVP
jgi:hypothetical protein